MKTIGYLLLYILWCVLRSIALVFIIPMWCIIMLVECLTPDFKRMKDSLPSPRAKRGGDGERNEKEGTNENDGIEDR